MGFVTDFLDAMEYLIQKYQKECTAIYSGVVQSVSEKTCAMNINGNNYKNVSYYGTVPTIGNSYRVFVPFNNMSLAFIIVPSTTSSGKGKVDSVNGKTGDVILTATDVGALPDTTIIPSKTSQLENDSGYITSAESPVQSVNEKTGAVTLTADDVSAISTNKITQTLGTSSDNVPSEKAVSDAISAIESGDMLKSVYDADGSISTDGGISTYVSNQLTNYEQVYIANITGSGTTSSPYKCDTRTQVMWNQLLSGKHLMAKFGNVYYNFAGGNMAVIVFSNASNLNLSYFTVQVTGNVSHVSNAIEIQSNRVTSVSSSSTDTQYPTAKAVWTLFGTTGGTNISVSASQPSSQSEGDFWYEING